MILLLSISITKTNWKPIKRYKVRSIKKLTLTGIPNQDLNQQLELPFV